MSNKTKFKSLYSMPACEILLKIVININYYKISVRLKHIAKNSN